jgi:hypothetical protein
MRPLVDEGTVILARIDPEVSPICRRVLAVLAEGPTTLDQLAARLPDLGRRWVFHAVGELEERGRIPAGAIR